MEVARDVFDFQEMNFGIRDTGIGNQTHVHPQTPLRMATYAETRRAEVCSCECAFLRQS